MKIYEILKDENVGKKVRFTPPENKGAVTDYVIRNYYGEPELYEVGYEDYHDLQLEVNFFLKVVLDGNFEFID